MLKSSTLMALLSELLCDMIHVVCQCGNGFVIRQRCHVLAWIFFLGSYVYRIAVDGKVVVIYKCLEKNKNQSFTSMHYKTKLNAQNFCL